MLAPRETRHYCPTLDDHVSVTERRRVRDDRDSDDRTAGPGRTGPQTEGKAVAQHRSPGSHQPPPVLLREAPEHFPGRRGLPAPPTTLRGRLLVAAVTAGACVGAACSAEHAGDLTGTRHSADRGPQHAPLRPVGQVNRLPG